MTKDQEMLPYVGFTVQASLVRILAEGNGLPMDYHAAGDIPARRNPNPVPLNRHDINDMIRDVLDVLDEDDDLSGSSSSTPRAHYHHGDESSSSS
ncbi:expressed unknown protein [Seminavis robusta]|uniref:Uncharacterized protein n=1 Tax=Seminavis robusta TaxID=568900 RepID=A0A9N8E4D3_9STRA|nr:expressed unknown protein [Seminavis robusta]|eukprot:Sro636_g179340.1 n/a (95) ;mRNA; r:42808-43092